MTIGNVYVALPLIALGAFPVLIAGTSRLLLAGLLGRRVAFAPPLAFAPGVLFAAGSLAAALRADAALVALWSLGAACQVAVMFVTFRRRETPRAPSPSPPRSRLAVASIHILDEASLAYLVATAVVVPLVAAGRVPIPVFAHLALAGFVTLTIATVAMHVLPRFTGVAFPLPVLATFAPLVAVGPALLATGVAGDARVFVVGAAVEGTGLALFAGTVLVMLARSARPRASFVGYALACVSLLAGVTLGVFFAAEPSTRPLVPAHAVANAFGFVGGFVVGAAADLYAPSLFRGGRAFTIHTLATVVVLALGVASAFVGVVTHAPTFARLGMTLVALAGALLLAGSLATVLRARRLRRSAGSLAAPRVQ